MHWWHTRPVGWRRRAAINGVGAVATGVSTIIFLITKFVEGGWVVVVAVPLFIVLFHRIHRYYGQGGDILAFDERRPAGGATDGGDRARHQRLAPGRGPCARRCRSAGTWLPSPSFIDDEDEEHAASRRRWAAWDPGVPLRVLPTEYASVVEPIVALIDEERTSHDAQIVVLIPVVVPAKLRYRLLHNHIDVVLSAALRRRTDVVVARVPIEVDVGQLTSDTCRAGDESRRARQRIPHAATIPPNASSSVPGPNE